MGVAKMFQIRLGVASFDQLARCGRMHSQTSWELLEELSGMQPDRVGHYNS